jgi:hypothetical protein
MNTFLGVLIDQVDSLVQRPTVLNVILPLPPTILIPSLSLSLSLTLLSIFPPRPPEIFTKSLARTSTN